MRKRLSIFAICLWVFGLLAEINADIYVTNNHDNSVSVIDPVSKTIIGSITVGSQPISIAITPDGRFAYVVNNFSGTVSCIDLSTNTVIATIFVGASPYGVAISPDGSTVYVTNQSGNNISVISTSTNTVSATINGLSGPKGIAVTPNGNFAYVANFTGSNVRVIDTHTNTLLPVSIPVGSGPIGVAITPSGSFVYVTNSGGPSIDVIDTTSNMVVDTFPVGSNPSALAITPNGKFLYEVNSSSVGVFETINNSLITGISLPSPAGLAITSDGTLVYVTNNVDDSISIIDTSTNEEIGTITGSGLNFPIGIAIGSNRVPPASIMAPRAFTGRQKNNNGAAASERYNHLTWQIPLEAPDLAGYTLSFIKNGQLVTKTLKRSATSYNDHNQLSESVTYTLTAFTLEGASSSPVTVTIGGQ
ncbi:MAG TPA: beta-propeller fold lactonase family protein [Rhabdochlamydiaceae bacterium]|nr:beta-propeller fold lactonase family protein [Rhabdochlamydiaceae bacterium]